MAYITQEQKKEMAPKIKKLCKKYGVKATLKILDRRVFICTIRSGKLDFKKDKIGKRDGQYYENVNLYRINENYKGKSRDFLIKLHNLMLVGNRDNSNIMQDYFDVGRYEKILIGTEEKEYIKE